MLVQLLISVNLTRMNRHVWLPSTLLFLLWIFPSPRNSLPTGSLGRLLLQVVRNWDEEDIHPPENQPLSEVYLADLFEFLPLQLTPFWPKSVWKWVFLHYYFISQTANGFGEEEEICYLLKSLWRLSTITITHPIPNIGSIWVSTYLCCCPEKKKTIYKCVYYTHLYLYHFYTSSISRVTFPFCSSLCFDTEYYNLESHIVCHCCTMGSNQLTHWIKSSNPLFS